MPDFLSDADAAMALLRPLYEPVLAGAEEGVARAAAVVAGASEAGCFYEKPLVSHLQTTWVRHAVAVACAEDADMVPVEGGHLDLWRYGDDAVLWIKRLNAAGRFQNIWTRHQDRFRSQGRLPGIPADVRIVVGFQVDDSGTYLQDLKFCCPNAWHSLAWSFSVREDAESSLFVDQARSTPAADVEIVSLLRTQIHDALSGA